MKKILAVIMAVILSAFPIYANEMMAESTVIYTHGDNFYIQIPETIVVGEDIPVEAVEVNIAPNKSIYVDMALMNDYVEVFNEADNTRSLHVRFQSSEGNEITMTSPTVAVFGHDDQYASKTFTSYVENTIDALAGEYTGTAEFFIHCD